MDATKQKLQKQFDESLEQAHNDALLAEKRFERTKKRLAGEVRLGLVQHREHLHI